MSGCKHAAYTWRQPFCHLARHVCVDLRLHHHPRMQRSSFCISLGVSSFAGAPSGYVLYGGVALIKTVHFDTLPQLLTMWRYKSEETDVMVQFNKARTHTAACQPACRRDAAAASHSIEMRRSSDTAMMVDAPSQWRTRPNGSIIISRQLNKSKNK